MLALFQKIFRYSAQANLITCTPLAAFFGLVLCGGMSTANAADASAARATNSFNSCPSAADVSAEVDEDNSIVIKLPIIDNNDAHVVIDTQPHHGTVALAPETSNSVIYTPAPDFNGQDSFNYGVTNGECGRFLFGVTITVNPVGEASTADLNGDSLINSMDIDSDGDGFPDNIEIGYGASPEHADQTPTGLADNGFLQMFAKKHAIRARMARQAKPDRISMTGLIPLGAGISPTGMIVSLDVGGNIIPFVLDRKGHGRSGDSHIKIKFPKQSRKNPDALVKLARFRLVIKGDLNSDILLNSQLNHDGSPSDISVNMLINGSQYTTTQRIR